jgi:hypothetical protein
MNTKSLRISALLSAALFLTLSVSQADVETTQALNGATVTKIRVNGLSADMFLIDNATGTNGFLNASRDEIANTSALDFSYVTPEPDPNFVVLIQGAGAIPNSSFTITANTARLVLTTPFPVNRCRVNTVEGTFECGETVPSTFDLTWVRNGFGSLFTKATVIQTLGPVTTKLKGDFLSVTANVNGTWDGHDAVDQTGNIVDTQNRTITREVTMEANP